MNARELFAKLFVTNRYFTIGIRKRQQGSILEDPAFAPEFIVPASQGSWCADPILVDEGEKTWLFYEAVLGDREERRVGKECRSRWSTYH